LKFVCDLVLVIWNFAGLTLMDASFLHALLTPCAIACACALLSIPVMLRRWAFIGEGIGHAGFGGAGVAWMLATVLPVMNGVAMPYLTAIIFCTLTALAIGWVSRSERVNSDAVIGIFLVASLAFGFVAQQVYTHHFHATPAWFGEFLFGQTSDLSGAAALAATLLCVGVMLTIVMFAKEILAYCFDPTTAYTSGVRAGFIHYLLMVLLALTIVIGMRVVGGVLMTALLVLPGATAMLLSRRLTSVVIIAIASSVFAAIVGLVLSAKWTFIPAGPAMVLVMVAEFAVAYAGSYLRRV
jgi:ABC-type Mn2+/Zn2+ transport system permease subunit